MYSTKAGYSENRGTYAIDIFGEVNYHKNNHNFYSKVSEGALESKLTKITLLSLGTHNYTMLAQFGNGDAKNCSTRPSQTLMYCEGKDGLAWDC